jgi:hypothetical protein
MALENLIGGVCIPEPARHVASATAPTFSIFALNGAGDKVALFIGKAHNDMTIASIGCMLDAISGSTTINWRVETLDADGLPSGTLWAANTSFTQAVGTGSANAWMNITLTAAASIAANDSFAVIMEWSAGSSLSVRYACDIRLGYHPYVATKEAAGAWGKVAGDPVIGFQIATAGDVPQPNCWPIQALGTTALNTGTTPDEVGNRFQIPPYAAVLGLWWLGIAAGDYDALLSSGDAVEDVMETVVVDKDHSGSLANYGIHRHCFANREQISGVTNYNLTLRPSSATSITIPYVDTNTAAWMDQLQLGQNMHSVSRSDAGAFTALTTRRYLMGPILAKVEGNRSGISAARIVNGV